MRLIGFSPTVKIWGDASSNAEASSDGLLLEECGHCPLTLSSLFVHCMLTRVLLDSLPAVDKYVALGILSATFGGKSILVALSRQTTEPQSPTGFRKDWLYQQSLLFLCLSIFPQSE